MAYSADHARTRPVVMTWIIAAAGWVIAVTQMRGMDMGVDTGLGSFWFFLGVWTAMMTAMMLPGAGPAVSDYTRKHCRSGAAATFLTAYVGVWTLFGVASYTIYRPHGTTAAGAVTVAVGLYEFTPLKQRARQRCREPVRSGLHFGMHCLVSSVGLMFLLLALGAMSIAWMAVVAVMVLVQKLVPSRRALDAALASALVALGFVILIAPSSVPGLIPSM